MTLFDELYFDITLSGEKTEIRKLVSYLRSGELDEFFEIEPDYIDLGDEYDDAEDGDTVTVIFTNDDMGIEIDEFDTDEFLDVFCRAARRLDARGVLYDCDDGEYSFVSAAGDSYFLNAKKYNLFNDELDEAARREEKDED